MSLALFGSQYDSLFNTHDPVQTADLSDGRIVEAFSDENESSFGFRFRDESGAIAHQLTYAFTDANIFPVVNQHVGVTGTVAALVGGGFVCAVNAGGPGGTDILVRTFDANGNATSGVLRVTDVTGDRYLTGLTATSDGGFTVVWNDDTNASNPLTYPEDGHPTHENWDMLGRHYSSGGTAGSVFFAQASNPNIQLAEDQRNGDAVGLTNGDTAYVYLDVHRVTVPGLESYPRDISLLIHGNEVAVNDDYDVFNNSAVAFVTPKVIQLSNGTVVVGWVESIGGDSEWHGRVFKANGTAVTADLILASDTDFTNASFDMAAMDNGQFGLLYTVRDADSSAGVMLDTFNSTGGHLDTAFVSTAPGHQIAQSLTYLGDGALLASWSDQNMLVNGARNQVFVSPVSGQVVTTGNGTDEVFNGGNKADWIDGKGGDDTINGGSGDDHLIGNSGADHVNGGVGDDGLFGGAGDDRLDGGLDNNRFEGGGGADRLILGPGLDTVTYGAASESAHRDYDTVTGFDFAQDHFDVAWIVSGIDTAVATGSVGKKHFDSDVAAILDDAHLGANHAVLLTPDAGKYDGKMFLVIDGNGTAGYQAGEDVTVLLDGATNTASVDGGDFL